MADIMIYDGKSSVPIGVIRDRLEAAEAMLKALENMWAAYSKNLIRHGMNGDDTWTKEDHVEWQYVAPNACAAIEQARKAGITTGEDDGS
jgi:hypothetical protein